MKMARFNGYPIALWSSLPAAECRLRLMDQFGGAGQLGRHAASDKRLAGWQEGRGFVIYPWPYQDAGLYRRVRLSPQIDTARMCRIELQPHTGGTLISGRYAYADSNGLLLVFVIGVTLGIVVGALLVVAGLIMAFQIPSALWLAAFGGLVLGVCCWLIADARDGGFLRERAHIARFLMQVLEAQPAELLDPQPSEKQVQKLANKG